jgi:ABC-type transport system substrate-binding protein
LVIPLSSRQNMVIGHGASIIKSHDYGKTLTRAADENYREPMFKGGRFTNPFFIGYGQNYSIKAHDSDRFVYVISNNQYWDKGDSMLLSRVSRSANSALLAEDRQYCAGGNGDDEASWSLEIAKSVPILEKPGHCSMTGAQYIEVLNRYVMI